MQRGLCIFAVLSFDLVTFFHTPYHLACMHLFGPHGTLEVKALNGLTLKIAALIGSLQI